MQKMLSHFCHNTANMLAHTTSIANEIQIQFIIDII